MTKHCNYYLTLLLLTIVISGCSSLPKQEQQDEVVQSTGPEPVPVDQGLALDQTYFDQAKKLLDANNYEGVVELNNSAVEAGINTARLWNLSGVANRYQGRLKEAEKSYQAALSHNPEHLHSLMNLAILYDIYLQDLTKAMQYYLTYQDALEKQGKTNPQLKNWIADLKSRLSKTGS